ncbi:MAG: HAD-IA family hydrolase [Patescibacteria group bacterium]
MKKAVIFDLNGVFILSPKLSDRFRDAFGVPPEKFLPVLQANMAKVRSPGAASVFSYWKPFLEEWNVPLGEKEFINFWFDAEKENVAMVSLARELKAKGLRLFVLSNNLSERSAYYDSHFPFLNELFEKQYYSWQTGFIKPDERCFTTILAENNLKSEECVYFDDSQQNVAVAQSLGIEGHVFESAGEVKKLLGL